MSVENTESHDAHDSEWFEGEQVEHSAEDSSEHISVEPRRIHPGEQNGAGASLSHQDIEEIRVTPGRIQDQVQQRVAATRPAANLNASLQERYQAAAKEAANRFGLNVRDYQRRIFLEQGQREDVDTHFARVHFGPNGRRSNHRKLILVLQGNNERLTAEMDTRRHEPNGAVLSLRGGEYIYDNLARLDDPDTDVLQIKMGEQQIPMVRTPGAAVHTSAAWAHTINLVNQALDSQGLFEGKHYETMNVFGTSYGAGAAHEILTTLMGARYEAGGHVPRTGTSIYLDGVVHNSMPPVPVRGRPPSERHLHIYQTQSWLLGQGAPLTDPGLMPNTEQLEQIYLTNPRPHVRNDPHVDHREMNSASLNRGLFDDRIIPALRQDRFNGFDR